MKRFLSLVLSLVMVMSLVTVSAGAKDFTDDDAITYDEAVAVVSEVGIVDGYADGDFKPTNTLTRQAAAKIICNLILGPTTAAELHADTAPYPDVPTTSEFAGYIAFCQSRKIISGYADGTFKPGNTLTGYAFMKMLLGALGYDATLENYTGANWSINVAKQALHIGLNKGLTEDFNGLKAVNREEACLYAFNTLQADLVEYGQRLTTNINGTEVTLSSGGAQSRTWQSQNSRNDNIVKDNIMQFAEEYFNKLVKQDDWTKFMEPAYTWIYNKEEIGTYERVDLLVETYTAGVTGRDVYDLLKGSVIRDNDLEVYVDGYDAKGDGTVTLGGTSYAEFDKDDLIRSNNKNLGTTGDGVVTKVYLDADKELITIVSINTYLAKATADYNETKEYAPLNVFVSDANGKNFNVDVEDVPAVADVTEDTFYQVNLSYKGGDTTTAEVVVINDVELLEDATVTKFSASSNGSGTGKVTKLTTGGEEYKANVKAYYDDEILHQYNETLLTDNTYNVFVDANGYFIGVDLFEGTNNYVFITGYDLDGSHIAVKTATAAAILTDGTMETIKVNVKDTNDNIETALKDANKASGKKYFDKWVDGDNAENNWYTYTVDSNDVYTLKPADRSTKTTVPAAPNNVIRTDSLYVDGQGANTARVYGEDETVFLTADTDSVSKPSPDDIGITEVTGVYTGVQSVEIEVDGTDAYEMEGNVFTVYDSDHYIIAAVILGDAIGSNNNLAYILSGPKSEEIKDGVYYWEFDAVMDGELKTFTAKSNYPNDKYMLTNHVNDVLELRFDGDYVTDLKTVDADKIYTYAMTTSSTKIDDESVYFMKNLVKGNNVVSLSGNTMYITSNQKDTGLAIAKDAKAVVIQKENGETKKTEFSSVASAINYLADANENVAGKQYEGDIFALLNANTSAAWVVFNSKTELKTGAGAKDEFEGKYYKATAYIYENGFAALSVDVTRPAWLDMTDADGLDYTYDIYVNDAPYDSVNSGASNDVLQNKLTATTNWDNSTNNMFLFRPIKAGDRIEVRNFKFDFSDQTYFVEYVDQDGNVLYRDSNDSTKKIDTKDLKTVDGTLKADATGDVDFTIDGTKYVGGGTAAYTISNLTVADKTGTATVNVEAANGALQAKANLEDYVRVTIDLSGLTKAAPTYELKTDAALSAAKLAAIDVTSTGKAAVALNTINAALGDDTLQIKTDKAAATGLADSELITFTATLAAGADTKLNANAYEVELTTDAGNITFAVADGALVDNTKTLRINKADITIKDLTVTVKTPLLDVTSVTKVNDYTIQVKFNQGVCMTDGAGGFQAVDSTVVTTKDATGGATITPSVFTTTKDSDTVTIELPNALANGNVVTLSNGVLASAYTTNTLTAQEWTYNAANGRFTKTSP